MEHKVSVDFIEGSLWLVTYATMENYFESGRVITLEAVAFIASMDQVDNYMWLRTAMGGLTNLKDGVHLCFSIGFVGYSYKEEIDSFYFFLFIRVITFID